MPVSITIHNEYKSIKPCSFNLPNFCILTGKNGSGKSHLLEALEQNNAEIKINEQIAKNIKFIKFNQLNPQIEDICDPSIIRQHTKQYWNNFDNIKKNYAKDIENINIPNIYKFVNDRIGDNITANYVAKIVQNTKKKLIEVKEEDFFNEFDASFMGNNEFLMAHFALIFKNYHLLQDENIYNRYRISSGHDVANMPLSDDEFIKKYGLPPWDVVNEILNEVKVPYKVNNPLKTQRESSFELKLIDVNDNSVVISCNDLSTGEKVMMSLALAIYNTHENIGKPDLLLIDEPDAGLHPSMSKHLIEILRNYIIEKSHVPVIITTHSPTTVVAAHSIDIFEKIRGVSEPQKISKQDAVNILTEDIPFLRVSLENRRTIFVESEYDVAIYTKLFNIHHNTTSCQPIFVPTKPNKCEGSNCEQVKFLVNKLIQGGNDQVYGIIDWDNKNIGNNNIFVLGAGERYAIENYILDPLLIGLFMIREKFENIDFSYFGIQELKRWDEINYINVSQMQKIIDKILQDLGLFDSQEINEYYLKNGLILKISKKFNINNGHALEKLYKNKYRFLGRFSDDKKEDKNLKIQIIKMILEDYPQYTPQGIITTLEKIL